MSEYPSKLFSTLLLLIIPCFNSSAQQFLIPDEVIVQYAGSIGYASAGAGYEVFKNKRGNLDFNYGYVPASKGGELHIITAKFAYKPFKISINRWIKLYPLNPGMFLTYTFNKDLTVKFPRAIYPRGYYYRSEAIRPHLSFSNELEFSDKKILGKVNLRALSIYSEFNTNDYYLINFIQNTSSLPFSDIFKLGLGIRLKI